MKKLLLIGIFLLLTVVLVGCEGEKIYDCDAYTETDIVNHNELCEEFKGLGFLSERIMFEVNHYGYDETSEIDWFEVLYQHRPFYDSLIAFVENDVIRFDDTSLTFEDGDSGTVSIVYNDGKNQTQEKTFFVDVIDVTQTSNDFDKAYIPVSSMLEIEDSEYSLVFETLNNRYYGLHISNDTLDFQITEYIHRWASIPISPTLTINVYVAYLGFKVEVVTLDEEGTEIDIDTYVVQSVDNISGIDKGYLETNDDGGYEILFNNDSTYKVFIHNLELNPGTQYMSAEISITLNDIQVFHHAFAFSQGNNFVNNYVWDMPVIFHIEQLDTHKLWVHVRNEVNDLEVQSYVIYID